MTSLALSLGGALYCEFLKIDFEPPSEKKAKNKRKMKGSGMLKLKCTRQVHYHCLPSTKLYINDQLLNELQFRWKH